MATDFPGNLDNFTNPANGDKLDSPSHSEQHSDANDAITEIETKLGVGVSPAGSAVAGYALVHSTGGTTAWSPIVSVDGGSVIEPSDADLEGLIIQGATPEIATIGTATATAGTIIYEGTNTFTTGDEVKITGINPAQFNQHKATLSDATSTTFSVVGTAAGTYVSGGTAILYQGNLQEWKDYQGNVVASVNQFGESNLGGLVHINTTSFSSVASQTLTDVFSADYDHYRMVTTITSTSASQLFILFRFGLNGTPNTSANYENGGYFQDGTGGVSALAEVNGSAGRLATNAANNLEGYHATGDISNPFASIKTGYMGMGLGMANARRNNCLTLHNQNTSFTDFQIFPASGDIIGSISIYGYRKS